MNINKIVFCHRLKANYQISYCIRFNVHGQVRSLLDGFSFRTVNEEILNELSSMPSQTCQLQHKNEYRSSN
jgi:hypothetical protein